MSTPYAHITCTRSSPRLAGVGIAASLLLAVPLLATEADARMGGGGGGGRGGGGFSMGGGMGGGGARFGGGGPSMGRFGGGGGGFAVRSSGGSRFGNAGIGVRSIAGGGNRFAVGSSRVTGGSAARLAGTTAGNKAVLVGGTGNQAAAGAPVSRLANASGTFTTASALSRPGNLNLGGARAALGNRVIANAAFRSPLASGHRIHGHGIHHGHHHHHGFHHHAFHGKFHHHSHWPWWRGGIVVGWIGPVFWPYAYNDFFDYVLYPYAYDGFWPYAYDDVYYGLYGRYAYVDPAVRAGRPRGAPVAGSEKPVAGVCSENAPELTSWPIERITEVVEPTEAQRAALDELRSATASAVEILKEACPNDLPSIPTGRLAAMKIRLQVMLQAVQTVRPPLERFHQLLSDEQKARFTAVAPTDTAAAVGKDQRDLTHLCTERGAGVADLPIDRIAQAVRPTEAQRAALDELKLASAKASEGLKGNCPTYRALTPTGRVEAMEQRLDAMLEAVKTVQPALTKFYDGLSDEQKARFNTLGSTARPSA